MTTALLDTVTVTVAQVGAPTSPPDTPVLQSPSNGAVEVTLPITLEWSIATWAESYDVTIGTRDNPILYTGVLGTSLLVEDLAYEEQYFWQVRAVNSLGSSPWSEEWSFTTEAAESGDVMAAIMPMFMMVMMMGMVQSMSEGTS